MPIYENKRIIMTNNNILVIGGANIEYVLKSKTDIVQGSKNFVDIEELFGGSGVNYSLRLLSYGESVFPILFVGDDSTGRQIYDAMCDYMEIREKDFFVPTLTTPQSTIIVEGAHRTILSQDANRKNIFQAFVAKRIEHAEDIGAVIIGHIHNDRLEINTKDDTLTTLYTLEHFKDDKNTLVYVNFGASQLEYGFSFWKDHLEKVDILQLNIHELRTFISNGFTCDLACLIEKIHELHINMILTLDKFGAIGIMKDDKNTLFVARPIPNIKGFVDSTGSGDAYCAGMVSRLKGDKNFSANSFKEAMERGRSWATYACKSFGGANDCPAKKEIDTFHHDKNKDNEVVLYKDSAMKDVIALIDSMIA